MDISGAASQIIDIGIALNAERDLDRLMEKILFEAIELCSADGGTFYRTEGDQLRFEILRTKSLDIHQRAFRRARAEARVVPKVAPSRSVAGCEISGDAEMTADLSGVN